LKERETTLSEKCAFLECLVDVLSKAGQPDTAYHHKLTHIRSLDPTSQATELAVLDTVAAALSDPTLTLLIMPSSVLCASVPAVSAPPDIPTWRAG
ncbi:hypothetical protein BJY52DRAFT_1123534, partial [Lactarius psammicola]